MSRSCVFQFPFFYCEYTYYFRLQKICSRIVTWFCMVLSIAHLFCKVRTFWESQNCIEISLLQPIIESVMSQMRHFLFLRFFFPENAIYFSNIPKNHPLLFLAWNLNERSLFQSIFQNRQSSKIFRENFMDWSLGLKFFFWKKKKKICFILM